MTQGFIIPGEMTAANPAEMPAGPGIWAGEPHGPMPDPAMPGMPFDRGAIVEWMHDMIEARLPDGFPVPWDHGGPCNDPGPAGIPL